MEEEVFPTTQEGGHALMIEYGDCEFYGSCQCGVEFGMAKPNESWETKFGRKWERHTTLEVRS